ncbi:hypothetical protein SUDANB67_05602 (plasmid) [Nocardiopsis dassonvillei]|uniref:hypothetical protein n=1 Tax=Nocardiopsis dassonvillei TaxID=2014 RepID=UPI003F56912D
MADSLANEVIASSTDWTDRVMAPMRASEALITKGVVAARAGDLHAAVGYGRQALEDDRQSIPFLVMVDRELGELLPGSRRPGSTSRSFGLSPYEQPRVAFHLGFSDSHV